MSSVSTLFGMPLMFNFEVLLNGHMGLCIAILRCTATQGGPGLGSGHLEHWIKFMNWIFS